MLLVLIMTYTKKVIRKGDGKVFPKKGDRLRMHYVGKLKSNGKKFDSSRDKKTPFDFTIGHGSVIKGWDKGVLEMSLGELAELTISPDYGYGSKGAMGIIPPNATLTFEVELLKVGDVSAGWEKSKCCIIL